MGSPRFAAHLGLYPICWMNARGIGGTPPHFPPSTWSA
jgi:hypothetical protein